MIWVIRTEIISFLIVGRVPLLSTPLNSGDFDRTLSTILPRKFDSLLYPSLDFYIFYIL